MTVRPELSPDTTQATIRATVLAVVAEHAGQEGPLLPILHAVQQRLGWLPPEAVVTLAQALHLSRAEVHGVVSYYPHFHLQPVLGAVVQVCRAESCLSRGSEALHAQAQAHAEAVGGCHVESVYCLGLCALSPAIAIDGQPHARLTQQRLAALLDRLVEKPSSAPLASSQGASA
ncbi:MAG: NAD(P)H-dependent oxidoreductase subunit E [Leptothrix ochracea]|uniref:NAD(P)H-dependent oxidoreductase subunit E n=1 Tax=Leptothrix ochracea TaxID=735331 RepID=UPI0034E1D0E8